MCRKIFLLTSFILLVTFGVTKLALGMPLPSESLKVGTVIDIGKELVSGSSMYNPRSFGGKNYIVQINAPQRGVGCYPAGSTIYEALANIGDGAELRMAGAFQAANYVLLSGGADNDYFSRIDPNLNLDTRVIATNLDVRASSYDWVDDDTIIHNSYKSGLRANLYLTDINPDPFQVTANTSWNANGYVTTGATTRIRNVRVGDIYSGCAYYGDAGINTAGFYVIDLATGVSTQLGTLNVSGDGSWGLWTVKEVDGFLYVHTTHDGIYIYNMTDATTLGTLHTRYTKDKLDALAEDTNPNWGFDVVDDGARMLLSAGLGRVIEIINSRIADAPNPTSGSVDVRQTSILNWSPGEAAVSHDVYFGTGEDAVKNADISSPEYKGSRNLDSESYDPGKLEWNTTYYWRVDEVEDGGTIQKGNLWNFTTADFLIVDDMELYNDINEDEPGSNRIYLAWADGFDNPAINGSTVGHLDPPFAEQTIVHGGSQSMPYFYDNDMKYSEASMTLGSLRDWTVNGAEELALWFRGISASMSTFTEGPVGTYTMTARSGNIDDPSDSFHYVYMQLSGPGSIVVKVESVTETSTSAKAGVMIRETLEPDSKYAMVFSRPDGGIRFRRRIETAGESTNSVDNNLAVPHWVKLERDTAGLLTASHSVDGVNFVPVDDQNLGSSATVQMNTAVFIGLALSSNNPEETCSAVFSDINSTGTITGQWQSQDIGIESNDPEPMYVAVANSAGTPAVVYHDDPDAAATDTWTKWIIPLQKFADQGVNLTNVDRITIGFGDKNNLHTGGSGIVFFDDIGVGRSAP